MLTLLLGAGFSAPAGVPLASMLFRSRPQVDRISRERLVARVLAGWQTWEAAHHGASEEYLAYLQERGGQAWLDAQRFVGLVIALAMGRVEYVGARPTVTKHNVNRTTGVTCHESFWTAIFSQTSEVSVLTTNYDILPERGIRHVPRPRVHRPGFNYGDGAEHLAGGGYPSYAHIRRISAAGTVPVLKLHGSVSWAIRDNQVVHYHDCRPAIRGDAAIVAPVVAKILPAWLGPVWRKAQDALSAAATWIVVGYSLPGYDQLVRELLVRAARSDQVVHMFDPNPEVGSRFNALLPAATVTQHPGLPGGLAELAAVMNRQYGTAA